MNPAQRIVLALGTIAITAIVLFPSWIYVYHFEPRFAVYGTAGQRSERSAGHHAIWTAEVATNQAYLARLFSISADDSRAEYFSIRLDKDRLWLELAGALVVTGLLTVVLKSSNQESAPANDMD